MWRQRTENLSQFFFFWLFSVLFWFWEKLSSYVVHAVKYEYLGDMVSFIFGQNAISLLATQNRAYSRCTVYGVRCTVNFLLLFSFFFENPRIFALPSQWNFNKIFRFCLSIHKTRTREIIFVEIKTFAVTITIGQTDVGTYRIIEWSVFTLSALFVEEKIDL